MSRTRAGVLLGVAAYLIWGLSPLYWPLITDTTAAEIISHRIIWSLVFVALILTVRRQWGELSTLRAQPKALLALVAAGAAVAANWGVYIWAVRNDHLVESSLGYFINPLLVVLLGVVVLGERLRPLQWAAVGIATVAVVVLTVDYGRLPWIALVLASSFAVYGLLKKQATVGPLQSLGVETAALSLPAVGYLLVLSADGTGSLGRVSVGQHALLIGAGAFTAIPLLLFGAAARRVPLTTLGILQYLNPTMQFLFGVFLRHEPFPPSRFIGFALVWVGLAVFTADAIRSRGATLDPRPRRRSGNEPDRHCDPPLPEAAAELAG